jgi:hypothetical protein
MARIEEALESAAMNNVSSTDAISQLTKDVQALTLAVKKHQDTPHLYDMIKSVKVWALGLITFVLFHAISTAIETEGV